jgi:hypothetical protein
MGGATQGAKSGQTLVASGVGGGTGDGSDGFSWDGKEGST